MSGGDPLRDFRASVEDAADDGELSPADRNMLEKRRVRTGVSEADAAAILAEYAATSDTPTADAIGPPADSLVTTAPASPPTAAASRWSHLLSLPLDHGRLAPLFYAGAPRS